MNLENYHITHNNEHLQTGKVLLATPFSSSDIFEQAVVLLIEHSENQSIGLFLNKMLPPLIYKEFNKTLPHQIPLQLGGPVGLDELFFVHSLGEKIPHSVQLLPNVYVGGDFEIMQEYISQEHSFNQIRFFMGYCGWEKNQLQAEFDNNEWVVTTLTHSTIFAGETKNLWRNTLETMGEKYKIWAQFPKNPEYN
ncbi:MAG: YqgE/AlgH family protein [Bacteroidales bacterium]|jgi:putative transcriptional regulator|nr:YqgE/AlgH family protein [Bacteroidales bacterium]